MKDFIVILALFMLIALPFISLAAFLMSKLLVREPPDISKWFRK